MGHLVAQLVKGLSLDFGSGRDPRIVTSNRLWGFTPRVEPAWDLKILPLPLPLPAPHPDSLYSLKGVGGRRPESVKFQCKLFQSVLSICTFEEQFFFLFINRLFRFPENIKYLFLAQPVIYCTHSGCGSWNDSKSAGMCAGGSAASRTEWCLGSVLSPCNSNITSNEGDGQRREWNSQHSS